MSAGETFFERSIQVKRRAGIGLCLSGGGFRAALYHLGALWRLNQLGLLKEVDAISSVSGGSITAAVLAKTVDLWKSGIVERKDWVESIEEPLLSFTSQDIRTRPVIRGMMGRIFHVKNVGIRELEKTFFEDLSNQKLSDLPDPERVRFVFCAKDMIFKTIFRMERDYVGNSSVGRLKNTEDLTVAWAVAASSCFPPVFGPMRVGFDHGDFEGGKKLNKIDWDETGRMLRLTDGGLYDNLGIEPLWRDYKFVLSSDAGRPVKDEVPSDWDWRRYYDLVSDQTRALRMRSFFSMIASPAYDLSGCIWSIQKGGKADGYSKEVARNFIANIRTDLDQFTDGEARILINHSYFLTDHYIKKYLIEELQEHYSICDASLAAPYPEWMDEEKTLNELKQSDRKARRKSQTSGMT